MLAVTREAFGEAEEELDDEEEIGVAIPATMAILGMSFIGCAAAAGGAAAAFRVPRQVRHAGAPAGSGDGGCPSTAWALLAALILSGLATVVAMTRAGIDAFWASPASRCRACG